MDGTLKQCAYQGVPFFLDTIEESGGRRLSINEFPYQINAYLEDVGQKSTILSINGYLMVEHNSRTPFKELKELKNALASALSGGGIGILELSYFPTRLKVMCGEYSFSMNGKTKIDFKVSFSLVKEIKPTYTSISYRLDANKNFLNYVSGALQSLSRIVNFDLSSVYPYKSYIRQLEIAKEYIKDLFAGVSLSDGKASSDIANRINNLSISSYADYFNLIYDIATYEKKTNSLSVFVNALSYKTTDNLLQSKSKTRIKMVENEVALSHAFKQAFVGAYAVSLLQTNFDSKEQAIFHRANLSNVIDGEYDYPIDDNLNSLTELINTASTYITTQLANLSNIVTIEGHYQLLPATYWSYRLYGNLDFVDDLILRNNIPDPDFMPLSFKALSV